MLVEKSDLISLSGGVSTHTHTHSFQIIYRLN